MIITKRNWKTFKSENNKIEKLKEWKVISSKATEIKKLYYKGAYTTEPTECDVVGFVDDNEIILYINGQLHSIHPDYFADMQKREKFIILDIETPMSFKAEDGIREVAAIVIEDYKVVDKLHLAIIKDKEKYKNGYGAGLDAIEENEELKENFKAFISKYKYPIIAHNASFDRKFLKYWGWIDEKQKFYCSLNNIKARENLKSYKLKDLLIHYGIKKTQEHNAMADILDLLEILKIIKVDKWTLLGESKKDRERYPKKTRNYKNDKQKREDDKKKLEEAKENIIENIFNNKKIVFTGDMKEDRTQMRAIAIQYGATSPSTVSGKTDILVVGENAGSKLTKATELGIKIINEQDFWDIINKK